MIPILLTSVEDNNRVFLIDAELIRSVGPSPSGTNYSIIGEDFSGPLSILETPQEVQDKIIAAMRLMVSPTSMPTVNAIHSYEN